MTNTKKCTRCGKEYPATTEFFAPRTEAASRSGLSSYCRECLREIARERQARRRSDPGERERVLEEKRRYAMSELGREAKRRASETSNHQRRQRILGARWDWTAADWDEAKRQWKQTCVYCGTQSAQLHQDHFIPLSHPECPGTHPGNIVPACPSCNLRKGQLHPSDFIDPETYAHIADWLSKQDQQ